MTCSSVIQCLSNGSAENSKIISMFVLVSQLFGHLKVWLFFRKLGGKPYTRVVEQDDFSQFVKGTTIK